MVMMLFVDNDYYCDDDHNVGGDRDHRYQSIYLSIIIHVGGYSSNFLGGGACLSHDHATQYRFVLQSFTLWKEIMANMPKLWLLADLDMIKEGYRLVSA
jgi:hypothetical protein